MATPKKKATKAEAPKAKTCVVNCSTHPQWAPPHVANKPDAFEAFRAHQRASAGACVGKLKTIVG